MSLLSWWRWRWWRRCSIVLAKTQGRCGDPVSDYSTYRCEHCLEEKRVAFSCKSSFCLSCCKVYIDQWASHIGRTLHDGMCYRHVVLTVPDSIRMPFFYDRSLLADLMKCGVQMLGDALSWFKKRPVGFRHRASPG